MARPTSTTTESAISTRDIVQSQASRSTVVPEIGIPSSSSAAGAPSSRFKPGSVVVRLTWGRTPLRRGSKPFVHVVVEQLGQGVGHALALVAGVPGTPPPGEGVERGPEGGPGDRVEHAVDRVHAVEHGADLEPAPLEVLFGVGVETVGVGDMPGVAAADVEVLDRKGVGEADHLRLIGRLPSLTQLLAQMAERRGGLVADGAAGEGGRGLGQGAELPADTQPIGSCLA